jgi:hypothetical protein
MICVFWLDFTKIKLYNEIMEVYCGWNSKELPKHTELENLEFYLIVIKESNTDKPI